MTKATGLGRYGRIQSISGMEKGPGIFAHRTKVPCLLQRLLGSVV